MFTKRLIICFITALALLFGTSKTRADHWDSIEEKEFKSSSGKYVFKITPHEGRPHRPAHCKGVLFKVDGTEREEVWSRYLINNIGPVRVFVADSGKYVVTMDEWYRVGKLPVVIYGFRGELISVHSIKSLGLEYDRHIKLTISSYWWNRDAIIFFGPKEEYLFIRLHWGKMLIINLYNGEFYEKIVYSEIYSKNYYETVTKKWEELQAYANKKIEEIALLKLNSEDPDELKTGALVVGQLKIRKAIPRLNELLRDKAYYGKPGIFGLYHKVYYVREGAKEALKNMGVDIPFFEDWRWPAIFSIVVLFLILCGLYFKWRRHPKTQK